MCSMNNHVLHILFNREMAQKQRALRTDLETKEESFSKQVKENTDKSKNLARLLNTVEYNIKKEADKLETVKSDVTLSKKFSDQSLGNWRKISNSRPLDKNYTSVYDDNYHCLPTYILDIFKPW